MNNINNTSVSLEQILQLFASENQKEKNVKSLELLQAYNYYVELRKNNVRPDTISSYKSHLIPMIDYFKAHNVFETSQLNQEIIDKFITFELAKGVKNITINKRIKMLKAMLRILHETELIDEVSFKYSNLKETKPKIEVISEIDITKILTRINELKISHQLIIYLLISTGIRRNEIVHIKTCNINLKDKSIYLDFTKTGNPRFIYILDLYIDLIKKQMDNLKNSDNPYFFQNPSGTDHLDKISITSMLTKLKKDFDLDIVSSHKFRHLYATSLLKNGADIYTVKELLGHASLKMTQRYLDFTNEEIKQNNNKFNPLNKIKK